MVIETASAPGDQRAELVELYDQALPEVYGYLAARTPSVGIAEDLTSDTFLAAATSVLDGTVPQLTVAWLIGVARHKLVDHWRRTGREQRLLEAVGSPPEPTTDEWEVRLDAWTARDVLDSLAPHHRAALTLRYLDGLPVRQVAELLDRTEGATEALLVRARTAFRAAYPQEEDQ